MRFLPISQTLSAFTSLAALVSAIEYQETQGIFPSRCFPDPCDGILWLDDAFICGDWRLGPVKMPSSFPLNNMFESYYRLGDLCPSEFLAKWATDVGPAGLFVYPPNDGYVQDTEGNSITGDVVLPVGMKVDLFGTTASRLLRPLGTPFIARSQPPSDILGYYATSDWTYVAYEIIKAMPVKAGPTAPWFEQPGMGTQFQTYYSIWIMVQSGYLRKLSAEEYDEQIEFSDNYSAGPAS